MDEERSVVAGLRLRWQTLPGPDGAEAAFGLWVLDDPDATLDAITQEEFDRTDERMPYFATIWASAESLVAAVLEGPRLDGQRVLDLGCGLGACGFAAARHGARVTFFDWEPRALEVVAASASRQRAPAGTFDFVVGDWRRRAVRPVRPDPRGGRALRAAQRPGRGHFPGSPSEARRRSVDRRSGATRQAVPRPGRGGRAGAGEPDDPAAARARHRDHAAAPTPSCQPSERGARRLNGKWIVWHGRYVLLTEMPLTGGLDVAYLLIGLVLLAIVLGAMTWLTFTLLGFLLTLVVAGLVGWAADAVVPAACRAAGSAPSWPASSAGSSARWRSARSGRPSSTST